MKYDWIGLDYGSNLAGTTVISDASDGVLKLHTSTKGKSSDEWIKSWLDKNKYIKKVFIDAPLSLPGGFYGLNNEFHYRESDKLLKTMSPMFLGGLTARAKKLSVELIDAGCSLYEVHPASLERELFKKSTPKKEKPDLMKIAEYLKKISVEVPEISTRHEYDSMLCWITGWRYSKNFHTCYGSSNEGVIWI